MKKIKISGTDTYIYKEVLDNGFTIYLSPNTYKNSFCMNLVTNYGSINTEFIPNGKKDMVKVPNGIAHFLEHKIFENKDFEDPFTFAAKYGVECNASTYFNFTKYIFQGSKNYYKCLDYLFKFVYSPYFTDSNVEKEKGIIEEELLQYQDNVYSIMENAVQDAVLKEDTYRFDIGGTVKEIKTIKKEDLYLVYDNYYNPSNMFIVITGNFDINKTIKHIKNSKYLNSFKDKVSVSEKEYLEPNTVNKKEVKKEANITTPRVSYSIKIPVNKEKTFEKYTFSSLSNLFINIKFNRSSQFMEDIKKHKDIIGFGYVRNITRKHIILTFHAQTSNYKKFIKLIEDELKKDDITVEDLERYKKVWISYYVLSSDDIYSLNSMIISDVLYWEDVINNKIDLIKEVKVDNFKEMYKLDFSNTSTVILTPKIK